MCPEIRSINTSVTQTEAEAVVVGVFADSPPTGPAAEIDRATGGLIGSLIESEEITGKIGEAVPIWGAAGVAAQQVVLVGLGSADTLSTDVAFRAAATAARHLSAKERVRIAYFLGDDWPIQLVENAIAGALVGSQGQDLYRAEKKSFPPNEILWDVGSSDAIEPAIASGKILGESINLARRLVNEPADRIYPASFAEKAAQVAGHCSLGIEIWDKQRLEDERCGAILAVAQGSAQEPRLVILRHHGAGEDDPILALVGKGVTFDSGGLSIKTSEGMQTMKCDMAGAATVLAAMQAIAQLKLPINVTGLVGLTENMTGAGAYKLGDVLTARSGTTIEVLNTDAEGRLVLADVLDVARGEGASHIVDLATLTGACVVALGLEVAGLMTNDDAWCDRIADAADAAGELVWQLPMFDLFDEQIQSNVADIKNIGAGRWGGAITAAKFLEEFVGDTPWTHIDIAGPAFLDKAQPWCDAGGTGTMVRTLVELARRHSD